MLIGSYILVPRTEYLVSIKKPTFSTSSTCKYFMWGKVLDLLY
jgi:hypothetical protein